ncbi:hypothetical protein RXV86_09885 [Alisedimentitalea sp. MJ-SS2]|uniref:hypothetical protein n=1 Tax=Aliisedimentitalea sp. MJ-SS2 TaxID=3049795 RepID=UPI00290CAE78|nr:hypothetical protein [Alisedimentitalea sp. MJ-SS2]MDU8927692.1 hypothetical protein [Alisedimentitalea sp. MJ-SS2]
MKTSIFACAHLAAVFVAGVAVAQDTADSASGAEGTSPPSLHLKLDGIDRNVAAFCGELGRPVTQRDLAGLSGYEIRRYADGKELYREVIGPFGKTGDKVRSSRFFADGTRRAQYIEIRDRLLCLDTPDGQETECARPIVCKADNAEFVAFDRHDNPLLSISKSLPADPEAQANDWVQYARGTAQLSLADDNPLSGRVTPARYVLGSKTCNVGAGHPEVDQAYSYVWNQGSCSGGVARGRGEIHFIDKTGKMGAVPVGVGRGIETRGGRLYWSFPKFDYALRVECMTANKGIPRSAEEVASAELTLTIPGNIEVGEKLVYERLAKTAVPVARDICRPAQDVPIDLSLFLQRSKSPLLVVRHRAGNVSVRSQNAQVLRSERSRDSAVRSKSRGRFANDLRFFLENERTRNLQALISRGGEFRNLADAMRSLHIKSLIALSEGVTITFPWRKPTFASDQFSVAWRTKSTDPVDVFYTRQPSGSAWHALRSAVPKASHNQVNLLVTCRIPKRDAKQFAANRRVSSRATLLSFSQGNMVLNCRRN